METKTKKAEQQTPDVILAGLQVTAAQQIALATLVTEVVTKRVDGCRVFGAWMRDRDLIVMVGTEANTACRVKIGTKGGYDALDCSTYESATVSFMGTCDLHFTAQTARRDAKAAMTAKAIEAKAKADKAIADAANGKAKTENK